MMNSIYYIDKKSVSKKKEKKERNILQRKSKKLPLRLGKSYTDQLPSNSVRA